jgi:cbb3-type cytochrome oxidase maturation protein
MNVLFILVPLALLLAGLGVWAFAWAVRRGQFDDVHTPAMRMLVDDEENSELRNQKSEMDEASSTDVQPRPQASGKDPEG